MDPRAEDVHRHVIQREGAVERIQVEFEQLVQDFLERARGVWGADLHSLYLYGSIPRGTARTGLSDMDGQVLLRRPPTDADTAAVRTLEEELGADHPEVAFVGILIDDVAALTDPADQHDGGFHLRVLCTPIWGPDAGVLIAPHVPDVALALGVQGDWLGAIERLRSRAAESLAPVEVADLCRATGRRLARIAFSWVLPRCGGWTSDPAVMLQAVSRHEPTWVEAMEAAVALGWEQRADLELARTLLDGWADELITAGRDLSG